MHQLYLLTTIIDRKLTRRFAAFYESQNLPVSVTTLGSGTAASEILDYFGLDGSEKSVMFHVVTGTTWKIRKSSLRCGPPRAAGYMYCRSTCSHLPACCIRRL